MRWPRADPRTRPIRQIAHTWCVLIDTSQHTAPFFARFGFEALRTIPDGYEPGLVREGITAGTTPDEFSPNQKISRAQMAVFLNRRSCG